MKSKRYRKILTTLESQRDYRITEAVQALKNNSGSSEKPSNLEVSFTLNWNTKQSNLRDFVFIPYPVKREIIAIIDEEVPTSLTKRPDIVFIKFEELSKVVSRKKKSTWGFSKLIAHSSLVDKLKPFAKILSLKKMFPNYKDGTLTDDLLTSIEELDRGRIELRNDKGGNFHVLIGKTFFTTEQIESNFWTIFKKIISLKPSNWKGEYLKSVTISTTMGPGIRIIV